MSRVSARQRLAAQLATVVAGSVSARMLVVGSLPPMGRDLDLLVLREERERLTRSLVAHGFAQKGSVFTSFGACSAYAVELIDADGYLAAEPREELFRSARPLSGLEPLAQPAPHHALLILARLVEEEGELSVKRRARYERIVAEDPAAWSSARREAESWDAVRALAALEDALLGAPSRRGGTARAHRAVARARSRLGGPRPLLVSFSGIDGSGKSSQARWLHQTLTEDLGVDADLIWNDLLGNFTQDLVGRPLKAALRALGRDAGPMANYDDLRPAAAGVTANPSAGRPAWATFVTLSNALEQRTLALRSFARGRSVVFDRGPLDLAVRMEVLYRSGVQRQRRIVELMAARPALAFFLEIPPELSLSRKHDVWSPAQLEDHARIYRALAPRFGAIRLDGRRPPEELAAEIARAVWERID